MSMERGTEGYEPGGYMGHLEERWRSEPLRWLWREKKE